MKERFNNKHRVVAMVTAILMVIGCGMLSGCGKKGEEIVSQGTVTYPADGIYPLQSDTVLTLWAPINGILGTMVTNFSESPLAQEMEAKIGAKVTYLHPAAGMENEQFNLMLASNELPDIVCFNWHKYGGDKAIDEGYIYPLNDIMEKWAPNLSALIEENPEIGKMMKTDKGNYYAFPFIRGDLNLCVYGGPIMRKDWLDKVGMDVPETIDEWEAVLTAFKDELGAKAPLCLAGKAPFSAGVVTGAYGVTSGLFVQDGKVKYGPIEAGYKDFIIKMKDWYDKGLLDANFAGTDTKILNSNLLNDKTGITYGLVGGGIGDWLEAKKSTGDTEFDLVGAPYPVLNKGDVPMMGQFDWQYTPNAAWVISKDCQNVELAARYMDYGYGEEGNLLYNYGTEGLTYEMVDGVPTLTDFVINNPDGLTIMQVLSKYVYASGSGPCVQQWNLKKQMNAYPQQSAANETWKHTDAQNHQMPLVTLTAEESEEYANISADVLTYAEEMMYGFIMGTASLDDYDKYLDRMKQLRVDRMIEIQQQALDRYNAR